MVDIPNMTLGVCSHKDGAQCNTGLASLASSFVCVDAGIRILTAGDVKLH